MKKEKETIIIEGKKYLKYFDPINLCFVVENPRNKKAFAMNSHMITGGYETLFKECKCCGETMPNGRTYVKPLNKKMLDMVIKYGINEIK